MKGRHGTRMVQVVTKDWMLQIILDEPPQILENKWRNDRVEYYKRLEPTEAPRDAEPYLPPKGKKAKALRLENEASDRMWELLLVDDKLNDLKHVKEQAALLAGSAEAKADRMDTQEEMDDADSITDPMLKGLDVRLRWVSRGSLRQYAHQRARVQGAYNCG